MRRLEVGGRRLRGNLGRGERGAGLGVSACVFSDEPCSNRGKVGRPTAARPRPLLSTSMSRPDNFRTRHWRCGDHSLLLSTSFARAFTTPWLLVSTRVSSCSRKERERKGNMQTKDPAWQFAIPVPSSSRARPASARGPSTSSSSKYALFHPSLCDRDP